MGERTNGERTCMVDSYPAAPWSLRGWAAMTLQPVDFATARAHTAPGLRVVRLSPRTAIGGLYVASYEAGSTLVYHELIVISAIVRQGLRVGGHIPRIYVDEQQSLTGGRIIWGLPKELARFGVFAEGRRRTIIVTQRELTVCRLEIEELAPAIRMPLPLPAFGHDEHDPLFFVGRLTSRVGRARIRVTIPGDSPLAPFGLDRPRLGVAFTGLDLTVGAPRAERVRGAVAAEPQLGVVRTTIAAKRFMVSSPVARAGSPDA